MKRQDGFTIIELMIATSILSIILLMVTVVITNIGNLYYKGINQSAIQNDARTIVGQISEDIQFSGNTPVTCIQAPLPGANCPASLAGQKVYVTCIGSVRYTYVQKVKLGTKIGATTFNHVIWRDTPNSCDPTTGANLSALNPSIAAYKGAELISSNSRLTNLLVGSNQPTSLIIGIAYGDDDLLNLSASPVTCNGGAGDKFCATANLQTVVMQRVSN